ncbi:MAG: hypothetical protein MSB12_01080 [Lentisphaeraceae bacterium]|nr:hypothetical protein [Lentisphaeraceae bacterium]
MKSKLLAILCVLSLMGWSHAEEAASGNVAAITVGETTKEYATLDEAITAANEAGASQAVTVKLLQNVTRTTDVRLGADHPITLDLAGFTLDCGTAQFHTWSTGLVTLTGNGTVKNSNNEKTSKCAAVFVVGASSLLLDGVTVEGTYGLYVIGTAEVLAANVSATDVALAVNNSAQVTIGTAQGDNSAILFEGAGNSISTQAAAGESGMRVKIYSGTFNVTNPADWDYATIYWASHGALEVYGGSFKNPGTKKAPALYQKNGSVTIAGGSFEGHDALKLGAEATDTTEVVLTVTDGRFHALTRAGLYYKTTDKGYNCTQYEISISGGTFASEVPVDTITTSLKSPVITPSVNFTGGLFTADVSAYCAAGYMASKTTVGGETLWAVQPAVAQIGGKRYTSLAEAVEAVPADGTEKTIVLLQSCTGSGVKVAANKNIVFDLNGNTYTVTDPAVGSSGTETNAFQLLKGATVTFRNGALESVATGAKILIQNYCNLTLDGVTLNAQRSDKIAYTLSNNCGQVTVTGATKLYASAEQVAFDLYYWPNGGYGEGVSVTFDENFTGQVEGKIEYDHDNTVNDADCAEKAILTVAEGAQGLFDVTFSTSVAGANIQLKGGRYTTAPSTYCPAGYTATETTVEGETLWAVQPAVAQIGETSYATLAAAVEAVPADGTETTIVLLQSCTGSGVKVAANKNIVFDLNGNTYTVTDPAVGSSGTETNAFQLLNGATVTFRNGALESVATGAQILIQNYCNLTLDGVTLNAQRFAKIAYALSNNCGQVTVTGETKLYASAGKVAFDLYYWPDGGYGEGVSVTFDENFTGQVEGKIEYAHDNTVTDADCAEKAILTVAEGAQGLFDVTFSTSVTGANIQLKGGRYTTAPSTYCSAGYTATKTTVEGETLWAVQPAVAQIGEKLYASLAEAIAAAQSGDKVTLLQDVTQEELEAVAAKALVTTGPKGELKDATVEVAEVLGGAFTVTKEANPETQKTETKLSYHYNFGVAGLEVNKQATKLVLSVVAKLTEGELPANRTLVGRTLQVALEKGDGTSATYSVANPVFNEHGECRVAVPWEAMTHGTNTIKVKVVK